jgi:dCMP deaminase
VTIDRERQLKQDAYYMGLAEAVESGAKCRGSKVGAVLVAGDRVIGTGYNGTPSGAVDCTDDGCVRCLDSWLAKQGRNGEMSDPAHTSGQALDRCICVHAEQNAFLTAARFGIHVEGATLYTTLLPCFGCLKESIQAGVVRVVYKAWYTAKYPEPLKVQYRDLVRVITEGHETRFESLGGGQVMFAEDAPPDPFEDASSSAMQPSDVASQSDA